MPGRDPRPDHERKRQEKDDALWTEKQKRGGCSVSCDSAVGARFPQERDHGDRRARKAHREGEQEQVLRGIEHGQGHEQHDEGCEQE